MLVSVLMSVYASDRATYLDLALRSQNDQRDAFQEIILVEDGPLPMALQDTIERYRSALPVVSVKLPVNQGLGAALSVGLDRCSGVYIARVDADDISLPDRIRVQSEFLSEHPETDILGSYAYEIDEHGIRQRVRTMPHSHEDIHRLLWSDPLIHPSVMFRRAAITSVGGYAPAALRCEDYDLWFRSAKAGLRFANIPRPLIEYRYTQDSLRRQKARDKWRQALVGFHGSRALGFPIWAQFACFAPFARSLLPHSIQPHAHRLLHRFDPRRPAGSR